MVARRGARRNAFIFLTASDSRFRTVVLDLIIFSILGRLDCHVAIWTLLLARVSYVALSYLLGQLFVLADYFVELLGGFIILFF